MEVTAAVLAAELERLTRENEGLTVSWDAITAFHLVAILQLALRHPGLPYHTRAAAAELVDDFRSWFEGIGASVVVQAIDEGNDPAKDVQTKETGDEIQNAEGERPTGPRTPTGR